MFERRCLQECGRGPECRGRVDLTSALGVLVACCSSQIAQSGDSISVTTTVPLSYVLIAAVFAGSAVGVLMAAVLMVIMLRPDAIESIKPCVKVVSSLHLPGMPCVTHNTTFRWMIHICATGLLDC